MSMVDWYVEGVEFTNCNCSFGCPCQFEALPTHGDCRGVEVIRVDKGHFGGVDLSGLTVAMLYAWPGPVFEGGGELQAVIEALLPACHNHYAIRILQLFAGGAWQRQDKMLQA